MADALARLILLHRAARARAPRASPRRGAPARRRRARPRRWCARTPVGRAREQKIHALLAALELEAAGGLRELQQLEHFGGKKVREVALERGGRVHRAPQRTSPTTRPAASLFPRIMPQVVPAEHHDLDHGGAEQGAERDLGERRERLEPAGRASACSSTSRPTRHAITDAGQAPERRRLDAHRAHEHVEAGAAHAAASRSAAPPAQTTQAGSRRRPRARRAAVRLNTMSTSGSSTRAERRDLPRAPRHPAVRHVARSRPARKNASASAKWRSSRNSARPGSEHDAQQRERDRQVDRRQPVALGGRAADRGGASRTRTPAQSRARYRAGTSRPGDGRRPARARVANRNAAAKKPSATLQIERTVAGAASSCARTCAATRRV